MHQVQPVPFTIIRPHQAPHHMTQHHNHGGNAAQAFQWPSRPGFCACISEI
jgi:hypothetical protein